MVLPFAVGDGDKIGFRKSRGELQDRLGDPDIVVVGKCAHDIDGRLENRSELPREFGARLALDLVDEQREDVVEQIDLRIVVAAGAGKIERGYALQDFAAPGARG